MPPFLPGVPRPPLRLGAGADSRRHGGEIPVRVAISGRQRHGAGTPPRGDDRPAGQTRARAAARGRGPGVDPRGDPRPRLPRSRPRLAGEAARIASGARSVSGPGPALFGHLESHAVRPRQSYPGEARRARRLRESGRDLALGRDQGRARTPRHARRPRPARCRGRPPRAIPGTADAPLRRSRCTLRPPTRLRAGRRGNTPLAHGREWTGQVGRAGAVRPRFSQGTPRSIRAGTLRRRQPADDLAAHHAAPAHPGAPAPVRIDAARCQVARRDHPHVPGRHHQPAGVGPVGPGLRRPQPARRRRPGRHARLAARALTGERAGSLQRRDRVRNEPRGC